MRNAHQIFAIVALFASTATSVLAAPHGLALELEVWRLAPDRYTGQ